VNYSCDVTNGLSDDAGFLTAFGLRVVYNRTGWLLADTSGLFNFLHSFSARLE
jgi:hypothetical protein